MPLPPSYLDAKAHRRLTGDEANLLMGFLQLEKQNSGIVESIDLDAAIRKLDPRLADQFFIAVMTKRLAVMRPDLSFSVPVLIWCAHMSDRVGVAVHWAYTMMDFDRRNGRPMTMNDWCNEFPEGPPPESEMHRLWDRQKGGGEGGDNLIDGREAWAMQHAELS